jgi:hypothetical protein
MMACLDGRRLSDGWSDRAEGEMNAPYPNARQRQMLQPLMQAQWTPLQRLVPAGETTFGNLITMGWIERSLPIIASPPIGLPR